MEYENIRRVLGFTSQGWVNTKLLASAVGTENGSEIDSIVSLGLE
jgi:hypothetical protein